jgi:hypothetical protein
MRVCERTCDVAQHADGFDDPHRSASRDARAKRLALDVRHDEVWPTTHVARAEHRHDVRMLQPGYHQDLATEALGVDVRHELGRENLYDYSALECLVVGDEDARHAPAAELALDGE